MTAEIKDRIQRLRALLASDRPKGRLEKLAIRREIRDLQVGHKRGLVWDEAEAQRVVAFAGFHHHWKGEFAGKVFVPEPWQESCILCPLFAWKRADGSRRFRVAYIEEGRKNGKTFMLAVILDKLLIADGEQGAEVYTVATTRDQARIVFRDCTKTVAASPELRARTKIFRTAIECPHLSGTLQPVSSEEGTLHGKNVHGAGIDELHAHKTSDVFDVIQTGTGARRQPLLVAITTAGYDQNSVCWREREYSRKVLERVFDDDSRFAFIACADDGDDFRDPLVWWKANPNLGVSLKREYLEQECQKAIESPSYENTFRRLHLNQWTQQDERWMPMLAWDSCGNEARAEDLQGLTCYGGLDLSSTTDLTACVLAFPPQAGCEQVRYLAHFWIPEAMMVERERRDRVPYSTWEKQGWLTTTPGNMIDFGFVRAWLAEQAEAFDLRQIAFDRWGAAHISTQLAEDGFEMIQFGQGFASMSAPMKELLGRVLNRQIDHGGNPVLRWNADAVVAKSDPAGNIKPVKPDHKKSANRIDGIVAMIMATDLALRNENTVAFVYSGM